MGPKSHCSLLAYINIWKELLSICLREKEKIVLFFKIIELLLWFKTPWGRPPGKTEERKPNPRATRMCESPGIAPGDGQAGIDWYITSPDLSSLLPTKLSKWGFSGPPTNSWTLCFNSFKHGGVLGLSFEVQKMLELMKPLLYVNHYNHSATNCFFANYCKNVVKSHPVSNVCWGYNFQLQRSRLCEMIDLSLLISKIKFLWWWPCQILGRDKWKNRNKTGKCSISRGLKGNFYHLSLNGKNTLHSAILTPNTLSDFKIEPENSKNYVSEQI